MAEKDYHVKILIVDDEKVNIDILIGFLKPYYQTVVAKNGEQAIKRLKSPPIPNLILLDILMPGMDGYAVCQAIKNDPSTRDIPIIFLSALDQTADKIKGFEVGGVDYITKPFQAEEVLARIRTHLIIQRQHNEIVEQHERFRKLADAAFEGIVIHDDGVILDVNRAIAGMTGYRREELIGQNSDKFLLKKSDAGTFNKIQGEADSDTIYQIRAVKKDGTEFPVEIQARKISWESRTVSVAAVRDMSWQTVLKQEQRVIRATLDDRDRFGGLVGKSRAMRNVYELILRASASEASVVIYGETGVGKELTARTIFDMSDNHTRCFIPVNCASIPEHLFESLFFGHRKGAFTGADQDHKGYFEQADGGVLFLDEVGELPSPMQAKLLRVLEDKTYVPVGGKTARSADVRIIAATNMELRLLVGRGKIRNDFFYRLHVLAVDLPPLRMHKEDIPLLVAHYLQQISNPQISVDDIPAGVINRFMEYEWPGNVRELNNEIQRWLSTGRIELSGQLPICADEPENEKPVAELPDNLPLSEAMEKLEQYYISRTLRINDGHKGKTAEILNVDRKTLYRKLKKYESTP